MITFIIYLNIFIFNILSVDSVPNNVYGKNLRFFPGDIDTDTSNETMSGSSSYYGNSKIRISRHPVKFVLYRRKTKKSGTVVKIESNRNHSVSCESDEESFYPKLPTIFLVHGWMRSIQMDLLQTIKNVLLSRYDCNVIAVDWSKDANNRYIIAAMDTRNVGRKMAKFIDWLVVYKNATLNNFHLIGHSMGAHVCGFAAYNMKTGKIPHITGLDPASPRFKNAGPKNRLDKSAAKFVDIIHTSAEIFGITRPIGHVDIYPNKGTKQPGCNYFDPLVATTCSHLRSFVFYTESIWSKHGFLCHKCPSYDSMIKNGKCSGQPTILMGYPTKHNARGVYYTATNANAPYARG